MNEKLVPDDLVERVDEFRRRQKPMTEAEFWELMREGRQHSCDRYYADKWDKEDKGKG